MSAAQAASIASEWSGTIVTSVGLVGIFAQAGSIRDAIDSFREPRRDSFLGPWIHMQPPSSWFHLSRSIPLGPALYGDREDGYCGATEVRLSRKAVVGHGRATRSMLLASFHNPDHLPVKLLPEMSSLPIGPDGVVRPRYTEKGSAEISWKDMPLTEMIKLNGEACIPITRKFLIMNFLVSSAIQIWRHAGPAGYRAAFSGYNGLYTVEVPLGGKAVVMFANHDLHRAGRDFHPTFFVRRVDKCVDMLAGVVINDKTKLNIAFPGGRKPPGDWFLQWERLGYSAHFGTRNFYMLMGGQDNMIDKLVQRKLEAEEPDTRSRLTPELYKVDSSPSVDTIVVEPPANGTIAGDESLILILPSLDPPEKGRLHVRSFEMRQLALALDSLPWSPLHWLMHRGMRDILLAYGKPLMDQYRQILAKTLQSAARSLQTQLIQRGWHSRFLTTNMAEIVYSAIMAGGGENGDTIRAVTSIAKEHCAPNLMDSELDQTYFWQNNMGSVIKLSRPGSSKRRTSARSRSSTPVRPSVSTDRSSSRMPEDAEIFLPTDTIIALTKFSVLEWSHAFDYMVYEDIPVNMLMR